MLDRRSANARGLTHRCGLMWRGCRYSAAFATRRNASSAQAQRRKMSCETGALNSALPLTK